MNIVYTDNNATTKVSPEVLEEMMPYFSELYGNPSSMHSFGGNVGGKIQEARERVARLINANPSEIVFTSCGTESDNAAIMAALELNPAKKHIITSAVEHPAIKNLCSYLERKGYHITFVSVDREGHLDTELIYEIIEKKADDIAVISLMWANNETGVIFPVEEVARKAAEKGILFHTDAVQAVGKIPIDVKAADIAMLSLSGHKIHAPKGIGALYVRQGIKFPPFLKGGHQEKGRRAGTENTASIIGLGKASELAKAHLNEMDTRIRGLRDYLEAELLAKIPASSVNGDKKNRLPNTLSIGFDAVEGESILLLMDQSGICASSGSACTSGSLDPSHVLMAMKVPFESAHGTIRFSLSTYNTKEEMSYIIEAMPPIIKRLRDISPFWKK
ncbi:MAG: cysteine desulfurase NifS [Desulfamplus sp.]|nr:cysteine desulfurase NifS [Desulfamplus sp.]